MLQFSNPLKSPIVPGFVEFNETLPSLYPCICIGVIQPIVALACELTSGAPIVSNCIFSGAFSSLQMENCKVVPPVTQKN